MPSRRASADTTGIGRSAAAVVPPVILRLRIPAPAGAGVRHLTSFRVTGQAIR
ncbi:hypothetical protein GCM10010305_39390 [Streptomyces termitum]|uniref:Uncharacterized protein n=1 Tax=Streptomyces termitum TaxID=67368 RepID=A0A918WB15_9ACTN|nr:hypothetical protein GCM10010305_39390 [Streptomyces termitum]